MTTTAAGLANSGFVGVDDYNFRRLDAKADISPPTKAGLNSKAVHRLRRAAAVALLLTGGQVNDHEGERSPLDEPRRQILIPITGKSVARQ